MSALDFRSEGLWFEAWSLQSCFFLDKEPYSRLSPFTQVYTWLPATVRESSKMEGLQRSDAARVSNMSRFNGGKLPGNSKHFFKKSNDKAVP